MMTPHTANEAILTPSLALLPAKMDSKLARILMLAIGLQESRFLHRRQIGNGIARGYWQFERGGGVKGVMEHPASSALAREVCKARGVPFDRQAVYEALEHDDLLACCFARLLLWTDPKPIPDNADDAYGLYLRVWRPGKAKPATWPDFYRQAQKAVIVSWASSP